MTTASQRKAESELALRNARQALAGATGESFALAAYALARAIGSCDLLGSHEHDPPTSADRIALAACEEFERRLGPWTSEAESLFARWFSAESIEAASTTCDELLAARQEAWEAWIGIDILWQSFDDDAAKLRSARVARFEVRLTGLLSEFDARLSDNRELLVSSSEWRRLLELADSLAPAYRESLPWWLDGTLNEVEAELQRESREFTTSIESLRRQVAAADRLNELVAPAALIGDSFSAVLNNVKVVHGLAAHGTDQPLAPLLAGALVWRSPDGAFLAQVSIPSAVVTDQHVLLTICHAAGPAMHQLAKTEFSTGQFRLGNVTAALEAARANVSAVALIDQLRAGECVMEINGQAWPSTEL